MKVIKFKFEHLLSATLFLSLIIALVPINPIMPYDGLDGSWMHAINIAIRNKMQFGSDIIFTFGPYGSIYTKMFSPYTDNFMLLGSFFIALCFYILIIDLFFEEKKYIILIFIFFIFFYRYYFDELLYYYCVLFIFFVVKLKNENNYVTNKLHAFKFVLLCSAIALFIFVKGTFLVFPIILFTSITYLFFKKNLKYAIIGIFSFFGSMILFWLLTHQEISNLYNYFINLLPIISGYSNAMGLDSYVFQLFIPIYLLFVFLIFVSLKKFYNKDKALFNYILISLSFFFFFYFKYAFTRQSGRPFNFASFFILGIIFFNIYLSLIWRKILFITAFFFMTILSMRYTNDINKYNLYYSLGLKFPDNSNNYKINKSKGLTSVIKFSTITFTNVFVDNFTYNFKNLFIGLQNRYYYKLDIIYYNSLKKIQLKRKILKIDSSVDLYNYNTIDLLANNLIWNPRPIFQSYSVYNKKLSTINSNFILSKNAPNMLLFNPETIDNRFPSSDEGLNYVNLLQYFNIYNLDTNYIYLKRRNYKNDITLKLIDRKSISYNKLYILPTDSNSIYFVKLHFNKNLISKILDKIYKLPILNIYTNTNENKQLKYRLIPDIAEDGFIISPLIINKNDFLFIYKKNIKDPIRLKDFKLKWNYGNDLLFNDKFTIELYQIINF